MIEILRGKRLEVRVTARGGWGIEGAKIEIQQIDTVQLRKYDGVTNYGGLFIFESLPAS